MKKRIGSLLLAIVMLFMVGSVLFSCGDDSPGTTTPEGTVPPPTDTSTTPEPTQPPENSFALVTDGTANFQLVYDQYASDLVQLRVNSLKSQLNGLGLSVNAVEDYRVPSRQDCEVLIGAGVRFRDEFSDIDVHTVGADGYIIKAVGQRVMIAGGSDEALCEAVDFFVENYLQITNETTAVGTVYISNTLYAERKTEYDITSVKVNGQDLSGYTIVADSSVKDAYAAAQNLQAALYTYAGVWLDIASTASGNAIRFEFVDKEALGTEGFRVDVKGNDLVVSCAYSNAFTKGVDAFVALRVRPVTGELAFASDFVYNHMVSVVRYSDFGARGDGVTDDMEAICLTHAYANEGGQTVMADSGASYYIGENKQVASVKTDTNWGNAKFILDDSKVDVDSPARNYNIFSINPDVGTFSLEGLVGTSLEKGQANIGVKPGFYCMLKIFDDNNLIYIRYGANQNNGTAQSEVILVDAEGNVDPDTPILWDYETVTRVTGYRVDDRAITVSGGEFITIANQAPSNYDYYARGINISRSNTILKDVKHRIQAGSEGDHGAPYGGFYGVNNANNVLIENCMMTGHKTYRTIGSAGTSVSMGTYDISAGNSNAVTWKDCAQYNSITDTTYWGVMGSNGCKNLTFDGCVLSRFDAHMGMYNTTIRDSEIGQAINAIGSGTLLIENTIRHGSSFMSLRQDYGSTWDGDVIIRNCTLKTTVVSPTLINASWISHDFGYTCYLPHTVTIENFKVDGNAQNLNIYSSFTSSANVANDAVNPYQITEEIIIIGDIMCGDKVMTYQIFPNPAIGDIIFADTVVTKRSSDEEET